MKDQSMEYWHIHSIQKEKFRWKNYDNSVLGAVISIFISLNMEQQSVLSVTSQNWTKKVPKGNRKCFPAAWPCHQNRTLETRDWWFLSLLLNERPVGTALCNQRRLRKLQGTVSRKRVNTLYKGKYLSTDNTKNRKGKKKLLLKK